MKLWIFYTEMKYNIRFWLILFVIQVFLFYIFSRSITIASFFYYFFTWKMKVHQLIFSIFKFSMGDVLYSIFIIYLLSLVYYKWSFLHFLKILNIGYFLYQLFWGMLYFQPPIIDKLPQTTSTFQDEKILMKKLLVDVNNERNNVSEDEKGIFKINSIHQVEIDILRVQHYLPKFLNIEITNVLNTKQSLFQKIMSSTGIMGYYNPFTSEAQYNNNVPDSAKPFTIAHENAHQLGFAREQEANFIGYLMGINSNNSDLKYSAKLFAFKSLMVRIKQQDDDFYNDILSQCSEAVKRDLRNEREFSEQNKGFLARFFAFSNDLFLKSNGQKGGSITYSYFIDLLLKYEFKLNL